MVYNFGLALLTAAYAGLLWALFIFGTIGTALGFFIFAYFKEHEYYLYFNYGYSKKMLWKRVWGINIIMIIVFLSLYAITIKLL